MKNDAHSDGSETLHGRIDDALDRRGFSTGRLRARAAAVVLALSLLPIGAAGFAAYRLTNLGGPDRLCDGAVTADQVHGLLGGGRVEDGTWTSYSTTEDSSGNSCTVRVRSGLFETSEKHVQFTIARNADDGPGELAASNARLFSGDSAGSVTPGVAWAVLPEGCQKGVRIEVRTNDAGGDEARARAAVAFANGVAKARSCGDRVLPAPTSLSAVGAETEPDWNNLCGLPGFAPAKNPEAQWRIPQQVTTATAPIWSCKLGGDPRYDGRVQQFAITTEPQATALTRKDGEQDSAVGRARWVAGGTLTATCQGKDVFFTIKGGYLKDTQSPFLFPDQQDLVRQFLTAGGKAIGCEPIL
ncbi:hypothetical protein ACFRMQ_02495 [Kitasatospora sp. NPDC056783]|uniref:hypothetical protein n=1 Tax=Kitasatospora sp. NPDC056783 TaxID=3345943 RepID=UPI00367448C5